MSAESAQPHWLDDVFEQANDSPADAVREREVPLKEHRALVAVGRLEVGSVPDPFEVRMEIRAQPGVPARPREYPGLVLVEPGTSWSGRARDDRRRPLPTRGTEDGSRAYPATSGRTLAGQAGARGGRSAGSTRMPSGAGAKLTRSAPGARQNR